MEATRMTNLVTTTTTPAQMADTIVERITSGTLTLHELAEIADGGLTVQNAFARVRVIAERQIAQQYLFDDTEYQHTIETLRTRGWTTARISGARKAAQLALLDIDQYIEAHTDAHKEASAVGVRRLVPVDHREERKSITHTYAAPPVDVEIARELGMHESDARTDLLVDAINEALQTMPNQRHAYVWAKYHGINDDGTLGDKWTFDGIAKQMPGGVVTREYVENSYYRACTHVYRTISVAALNRLRVAMSSH